MKVLVSAGHTTNPKSDRGAAGNGYIEGIEAVKLRDETARLLREAGVSVIEDGADGISEPLTKAVALARSVNIAIEYHFNASVNPTATGIEVLAKPNKKILAQQIAQAIQTATGVTLRGEQGYKSDSSGKHHRLAFCEAGGLIVEVCFISNKSDMQAYAANFKKICEGVAKILSAPEKPATEPTTTIKSVLVIPDGVTIGRGAKNQYVGEIQKKLAEKGYLKQSDIDNIFGVKTEQALQRFQKDNGLVADGIYGNRTKQFLFK